ncbi:MAG: ECF-type sigma factor [Planctomycetota bacterium]
MSDPTSGIDKIAALLKQGDRVTAERLLPLVYEDLRQLARGRIARLAPGKTMRATELVHEAWMRIVAGGDPGWQGRTHFFGAAANAMRNILVDQARRRAALKRDNKRKEQLPTELVELEHGLPYADLLTVHEALEELEREHARPAQVVLLRFFGGLQMADIAPMLEISLPTAERDWRFARAWLQDRLGAPSSQDE